MDYLRAQALAWALASGLLLAGPAFAVDEDCSPLGDDPYSSPHKYYPTAGNGGPTGSACQNFSSSANALPRAAQPATVYDNLGALRAAIVANTAMCSGGCTGTQTFIACGDKVQGAETWTWFRINVIPGAGGAAKGQNFSVRPNASGVNCAAPPDPHECTMGANIDALGGADNQLGSYEPPDVQCVNMGALGYCEFFLRDDYNPGGSGNPLPWARTKRDATHYDYQWRGTSTGITCAAPTSPPIEDVVTEAERCTGDYCEGVGSWPGCGFLNGDYICPEDFGERDCFKHTSGNLSCSDSAPTPPAPDNGTPGTKAPPDHQVQVCTGASSCQTVNNYDNDTVEGSSRPVPEGSGPGGSGPVGPGTGGSGNGPGTGSGGGLGDGEGDDPTADDSAAGGLDCTAPPTCDGDPIQCAQLQQQWRIRCVEAPSFEDVMAAGEFTDAEITGEVEGSDVDVGELDSSGPISVGSCPAPLNVTVMGQSLSLDVWQRGCDMAVLFGPIMLLIGWLTAAFILIRN